MTPPRVATAPVRAVVLAGVLVLVGGGLLAVLVATVLRSPQPRDATARDATAPSSAAASSTTPVSGGGSDRAGEPAAVRVLAAWDRRRCAAYAAGSSRRLAALYVAGSSAGARDVRVLRGYRRRGWRVSGMRMQLLAAHVLRRGPGGDWRIAVTDRLAGGVAVGDGRSVRLPRDTASRHVVTLVRGGDGRWRVAEVRAA